MRRLTFTLALLVMALTAAWADNVAIDETNFPDDKFRAYVSDEFDTDKDGQLSDDEIAAATYITVYYSGIESLKGIEYFTALTNLECFSNQLTELDLSYNTALEHLDCSDNGITELDLSNNKALTELYCNGNQLTKLDLSNNTALEKLVCYVNKLTGLDLSNNTALTGLSCYGNQITKLDLSNNTALGQLSCYGNKLTKLDLSNNKALTSLDCNGNQLTKLDLSNNTALTVLNCDNTQLTKLDLSNNTALTGLSCQKNQLTELDLSNNTELAYAYCTDNQLTGLNVSKNTKLSQLLCNNNHITAIDLSNNTELIYIAFEKNQLVALDLSKNTKLSYVLYDGNERNMGEVDFNGFTVEGLDMTRVSNVSGATVVDGKFVPTDNTVTKITYTYDTQHVMKGITFRLKVTPVGTAVSAPTFGTEPGKYLTRVDVDINRPYDGADVYYTTNGSTPTALSETLNSNGYVTIDKEGKSTIKAVTIKDGVASDVASLEIEIIKPKLSVTNIDEKYEGWTAYLIDYDENTDDLLSSAQQSILIYTHDYALQFSNSDTWEEHYAKMTAGGEYVTVKDSKIEISYVPTTYADSYFAIAFFEDGVTCGSKYEMLDTYMFTIDDQGVFNVNEFHPNPIIIGTLRSDNEEAAVNEEEKALASLMGKTVYAMDDNGMFTRLFINSKGQLTTTIVASNTNITMPIASMCSFTKDGNNYIVTSNMDGDNSYTFVVEDGKVTKIDYYEEGTFVQSLLPSAEYTLAALMGSSEYTDGNRTFRVNNDGKIEDVRNETFLLSLDFSFSLKADGNYELTGKYEDCKYDNLIFYVVNQKVTKIEYYFKDNLTATYLPPAEDVLVALIGDTEYVNETDFSIYVNALGKLVLEGSSFANYFTFSLNADGNYVANGKNGLNYEYIFYVENGKVTKIEENVNGKLYTTYLPKQETPTAITAPAAEKAVKAYKTIENGEIVIVKDGERFNLRGAKIK